MGAEVLTPAPFYIIMVLSDGAISPENERRKEMTQEEREKELQEEYGEDWEAYLAVDLAEERKRRLVRMAAGFKFNWKYNVVDDQAFEEDSDLAYEQGFLRAEMVTAIKAVMYVYNIDYQAASDLVDEVSEFDMIMDAGDYSD
jgi:hypothetical protein